jgi:hypothetical protein
VPVTLSHNLRRERPPSEDPGRERPPSGQSGHARLEPSGRRWPVTGGRKWPVTGVQLGSAVLAASAALLLTAACGGGSGTTNTNQAASTAQAGGQNRQALTAYVDCLKENGVTVTLPSRNPSARGSARPTDRASGFPTDRPSGNPSGGPGGGGQRGGFGAIQKPANVDEATWQKAQQACQSKMPTFGPGGNGNGSRLAAYRNCMQNHGVTMTGGLNQLNTADPKVVAAEKACAPLRPTSRPSGSPSATT